jgi:malic enzyme
MEGESKKAARSDLDEAALYFHKHPRPGKLEIQATKPLGNQRDLALAYSPGVAAPCLESATIRQQPPTTRRGPIWSASFPTARPCSVWAISARWPPSR